MASDLGDWEAEQPVIREQLVAQIDQGSLPPDSADWRTPFINYLTTGSLPNEAKTAQLLKKRAGRFTMIGEVLYKRSFSRPLLKCIGPEDADYVLRELHLGVCGSHSGGRTLSRKVLLAGYFWPTLQADAAHMIATCHSCQKHQVVPRHPPESMKASDVSCPFDQWGMDLVGPLPQGPQQKKFLVVAVDYFSKWVEAESLSSITESAIIRFLWRNIVCRFGIPRRLVSDNGRQFQGQKIREWCTNLKIQQVFTSVYYPQSNGQTEVINRELIRGIKTKLDQVGSSWVEELPYVLWAYRTTPRESTGLTPFHLVYGGEAVVPVEIGCASGRIREYTDEEDNAQQRAAELDLITETRDLTNLRLATYRQRMSRAYNKKVIPRSFQVGDFVWKKRNPMGEVGKLEPRWEGPYRVTCRLDNGAYYLADNQGKDLPRPWHAFHLRSYVT